VPTLPLAAALLPVLAYCLARAVVPGAAPQAHRRDLYVWHVLLGLAMVVGLLGPVVPVAVLLATVSLAGLGWGLLSLDRRPVRGAYARLAVGGAAMAVMTLPVTLTGPAQAAPGHAPMAGMAAPDHTVWLALVPVLLAAMAIAGVSAAVVALGRTSPAVRRLDACCDIVMAGVMAVMLAGLL
jgi:uncharacterized protein DUF5134